VTGMKLLPQEPDDEETNEEATELVEIGDVIHLVTKTHAARLHAKPVPEESKPLMPRKNPPKKSPNPGHTGKTMVLSIKGMPRDLMRKARMLAAKEEMSLKDLIIHAIEGKVLGLRDEE
jgi:hypothetical protein